MLLVADQPATIGALPVAAGLDAGAEVAYLPGLTMRRAADLDPGEAKTDALDAHTVTDPGTNATGAVIPHLAAQLRALRTQRDDAATQVEHLVEAHRLSLILGSTPDTATTTTAAFIAETASKTFPAPAHLAAHAGPAPVTRRSGTPIRAQSPSRRGNKRPKRAMSLPASAAPPDPVPPAYHNQKTNQGKHHNQTLITPTTQPCHIPSAMIRNGCLHTPPTPTTTT